MKEELIKEKKGVSLKKINYSILILVVIISVLLLTSTFMTHSSYSAVHDGTLNYIDWELTAKKLQIGSDYLTNEVRIFVTTGNIENLNNYFIEANETKRRDDALNLLKDSLNGTDAYTHLKNAMGESVDLMNAEYYAMALTALVYDIDYSSLPIEVKNVTLSDEDKALSKIEQRERAIDLVFGLDYQASKNYIISEVDNSIKELGQTTQASLDSAFSRLHDLLRIQKVLIVVMVLVIAFVIILTHIQIVHPIIKAIPVINEDKELPIEGAYEYRYLAKTYNEMYEINREQKKLLEYEATHDALTDLYNRHGFNAITSNFEFEHTAFVGIDIDFFKGINDNYGHGVGDDTLICLANELKKQFKPTDIISRLGGDEFIVIMKNVENNEETRQYIQNKICDINKTIMKGDTNIPKHSISVGVTFGEKDSDIEVLLKRADVALYEAKQSGKHCCVFYHE